MCGRIEHAIDFFLNFVYNAYRYTQTLTQHIKYLIASTQKKKRTHTYSTLDDQMKQNKNWRSNRFPCLKTKIE